MNLRKYIPHFTALVIFFAVTYIAFSPLFSGKVIDQTDLKQFKSMSHETVAFREKYGTEPLWTTTMYCGMPTTQISTLYPGNWLGTIDDAVHLWLPRPARYIFLCFIGFYILLMSMKTDPWLALAGSLAFGLSTMFFLNGEAGHNSKSNAIDYLPFIFAGIIWLNNGRRALGFAVVTLFMGLEFNANHVQITYYGFILFFLIFATYFIAAWKEKKWKNFSFATGLFLIATIIGIIPNAGNLMMTYEYSQYSNRSKTGLTIAPDMKSNISDQTGGISKKYALEWSNNFSELGTFIIPDYKGGATKSISKTEHANLDGVDKNYQGIIGTIPAYFGSQPFTNGPIYFGIIVVLFAVAGVFFIRNKLKWPLIIASLLAIFLSLGANMEWLTDLFMKFVPGYNKFRTVAMILVLAQICLPLLAVLGIDQLLKNKDAGNTRAARTVKIAGLALLVFCLLTAVAPRIFLNMEKPDEAAQYHQQFANQGYSAEDCDKYTAALFQNLSSLRAGLVQTDAMRAAFFLTAALLLWYFYDRKKINASYFIAGISLLVTADLLLIGNRIINSDSYITEEIAKAPPELKKVDAHLLEDTSYYRVANGLVDNPFIDATTSYYHHSIGGYHAAKLGWYEDLSNFCLKPELVKFATGIDSLKSNDSLLNIFLRQFPALNMINTKYFIIPNGKGAGLVTNPEANGNCWFVKNIREVVSRDSEIVALRNFDSKTTAVISTANKAGASPAASYEGEGNIRLTHHLPNEMRYESETAKNEFAVFSEIFYPGGWTATIDGKPAQILQVDYLLRGLEIPAGKHELVFTYAPVLYAKGNSIARLGSVLLLLSVTTGAVIAFIKKA